MAKKIAARLFSASLIALFIAAINWATGAQTASAQGNVYPLAGTTYNGVVESTGQISTSYNLRWLNNGELQMNTPADPETFTVAFEIWKGDNFIRLQNECTVYVDENLTGDPWTQATQTITDTGEGVAFSVTPIRGNVAWAALKCLYSNDYEPVEIAPLYLPLVARN